MRQLTRRFFLATTLPAIALFGNLDVRAAENATPGPVKRVALNGYDPVSYFIPGRPEKGSTSSGSNSTMRSTCSEARNIARCLIAIPIATRRSIPPIVRSVSPWTIRPKSTPSSWAISNGKLYVFHYKTDPAKFSTESADIIAKADANWASVKGSEVFDHNDETDRAARRIAMKGAKVIDPSDH